MESIAEIQSHMAKIGKTDFTLVLRLKEIVSIIWEVTQVNFTYECVSDPEARMLVMETGMQLLLRAMSGKIPLMHPTLTKALNLNLFPAYCKEVKLNELIEELNDIVGCQKTILEYLSQKPEVLLDRDEVLVDDDTWNLFLAKLQTFTQQYTELIQAVADLKFEKASLLSLIDKTIPIGENETHTENLIKCLAQPLIETIAAADGRLSSYHTQFPDAMGTSICETDSDSGYSDLSSNSSQLLLHPQVLNLGRLSDLKRTFDQDMSTPLQASMAELSLTKKRFTATYNLQVSVDLLLETAIIANEQLKMLKSYYMNSPHTEARYTESLCPLASDQAVQEGHHHLANHRSINLCQDVLTSLLGHIQNPSDLPFNSSSYINGPSDVLPSLTSESIGNQLKEGALIEDIASDARLLKASDTFVLL